MSDLKTYIDALTEQGLAVSFHPAELAGGYVQVVVTDGYDVKSGTSTIDYVQTLVNDFSEQLLRTRYEGNS